MDNGKMLLGMMFTSFNYLHILLTAGLICYVIYYLSMKRRQVFLTKGVRYDAKIIKTIHSHFRTSSYVQFVIQYNGDKQYKTPRYNSLHGYIFASNKCAVYVYKKKCYVADFDLIRLKGKDTCNKQENDFIEEYLIEANNYTNLNRDKYIMNRIEACRYQSDKYILFPPMPVKLADGAMVYFIIDIYIMADKPTMVFPAFDKEIRQYILNDFSSYSSMNMDIMCSILQKWVWEKSKKYYYINILDIKVGVM